MSKTVFTSKDIEVCLGVGNREQIYWYNKGYIRADIQDQKPRVFSMKQAINIGMIKYFNSQGYSLAHAARISILTTECLFVLMSDSQTIKKNKLGIPSDMSLMIHDGVLARILLQGVQDGSPLKMVFAVNTDLSSEERDAFCGDWKTEKGLVGSKEKLMSDATCIYALTSIIQKIVQKAGVAKVTDPYPTQIDSRITATPFGENGLYLMLDEIK